MFEKLKNLEEKHNELSVSLADPAVIANQDQYKKILSEYNEISPVVKTYLKYKKIDKQIEEAGLLLEDEKTEEDVKMLAQEEIDSLDEQKKELIEKLKMELVPRDPKDKANAILEIRAGTGGDEATLFAADLFRMYSRFAERESWKLEIMNSNYTGVGGVKEIIAMVSGKDVYGNLRHESGVHRVQRVPKTEASGRIHTSAVTVAVLPEVEDVDIEINENDLRIDRYCSSGPGGQSVNTTYSAVRITHVPTGLVVTCQDEKSQIKNKARAMKVLRSRLYDLKIQEQQREMATERRGQVGTGDRSEKIRTYNFPQGRVTDHRINLTVHQLDNVLDGEITKFIKELQKHYAQEKMKQEIDKL